MGRQGPGGECGPRAAGCAGGSEGVEGAAAKSYFADLGLVVPAELRFTGRPRQPPMDLVNVALSSAACSRPTTWPSSGPSPPTSSTPTRTPYTPFPPVPPSGPLSMCSARRLSTRQRSSGRHCVPPSHPKAGNSGLGWRSCPTTVTCVPPPTSANSLRPGPDPPFVDHLEVRCASGAHPPWSATRPDR